MLTLALCMTQSEPATTVAINRTVSRKIDGLAPDLLKSLIERQAAKSEPADHRLLALQKELSDVDDRLKRLCRSIEDGIVELDDILRERTLALKAQRERAKAALNHARSQCGTAAATDAQKIDAFARLMNAKLGAGDANTRKGYFRSIIDAEEVDDQTVRIIGSTDVLQAANTALPALQGTKPHSQAVAQTVGFGLGKSEMPYLSIGID